MSARFVKIVAEDGSVAEVAPRSVRVWLDKGWKLVEEEEVAATEVDEADSSEAQTEGTPVLEEPRHAAPTPAQPVSPSPSKAAPVVPAGPGQEA